MNYSSQEQFDLAVKESIATGRIPMILFEVTETETSYGMMPITILAISGSQYEKGM